MKPPNTVIVHVPAYLEPGYVYPSPENLAAQQLLQKHLHKPLSALCANLHAADIMYQLVELVRSLDTMTEAWCADTVRRIHYCTRKKHLKIALEILDADEAGTLAPCLAQRARVAISSLDEIHRLADEFVKAYPKPKRKYTRRPADTQLQLNL